MSFKALPVKIQRSKNLAGQVGLTKLGIEEGRGGKNSPSHLLVFLV